MNTNNPEMAIGYINHWLDDLKCERGDHKWSRWSSQLNGNVDQMTKSGDFSAYRACSVCHKEMPESRHVGQKNYIGWETWAERHYGGMLDKDKQHIEMVASIYRSLKWYKLIWQGIKKGLHI